MARSWNRAEVPHVEQIRSQNFHLQRPRKLVERAADRDVEPDGYFTIVDQEEPLPSVSFSPNEFRA